MLDKAPQIIADTINNETIVLNFNNGIYYQLKGSASLIWQEIEKGVDRESLISLFDQIFPAEISELHLFLDDLIKENVIIEINDKKSSRTLKHQITYHKPLYKKYTDMQSLLELDPVHEVYHHKKDNS